MRNGGALLSGLTNRQRVSSHRTERLHIDCDRIEQIWSRYPGLSPDTSPAQWPAGLLVADSEEIAAAGEALVARGTVSAIRLAVEGATAGLRSAWSEAPGNQAWEPVADVLVTGLGLGCAVPRELSWRAPAAFAVQIGGDGTHAAPFLGFEFLPGAGGAGLIAVASDPAGGLAQLTAAAGGNDWYQTWESYGGPGGDLVAYGLAGQALAVAGVLKRRPVSLQTRWVLTVPVIEPAHLAAVEPAWRRFVSSIARAVSSQAPALEAAALVAFGDPARAAFATQPLATAEGRPAPCDYLDLMYFVLAGLVQRELAGTGSPAGRQGARTSGLRTAVVARPGELWAWLTGAGPAGAPAMIAPS